MTNQQKEKNQKLSKFERAGNFITLYINVIVQSIILILFIGVPLYYLVVKMFGWHIIIFLLIYIFLTLLISPLSSKIKLGDYFMKWVKKF